MNNEYARHMHASQELLKWLEAKTPKEVSTDEYEHIIDYLVSPDAPTNYSRMTWEQTKSNTAKWDKIQQKHGEHIKEKSEDVEVELDFEDGFKIVRLIGKSAYEREGYLMRHCVASYHGRDVKVYSLRDAQNMPHCTIEQDKQIKGKGNGDIHPKYVDYVVRFLEHTGMKVRDSEMTHLGYKADPFSEFTLNKHYRNRYMPTDEPLRVDETRATLIDSFDEFKKLCTFAE